MAVNDRGAGHVPDASPLPPVEVLADGHRRQRMVQQRAAPVEREDVVELLHAEVRAPWRCPGSEAAGAHPVRRRPRNLTPEHGVVPPTLEGLDQRPHAAPATRKRIVHRQQHVLARRMAHALLAGGPVPEPGHVEHPIPLQLALRVAVGEHEHLDRDVLFTERLQPDRRASVARDDRRDGDVLVPILALRRQMLRQRLGEARGPRDDLVDQWNDLVRPHPLREVVVQLEAHALIATERVSERFEVACREPLEPHEWDANRPTGPLLIGASLGELTTFREASADPVRIRAGRALHPTCGPNLTSDAA